MTDDEKLAVVAAYRDATNAGDVDALAELTEPDAVIWHNFDNSEGTAEQSGKALSWLHRKVPGIAWTDRAVHLTAEGFVWQAEITGEAPGGPLRAQSCMVVTLSPAGKVARLEEYLDPSQVAVVRAG